MKTYTNEEGLAAIERAKALAITNKQTAIVRLVAISQVFYRHAVGEKALDALYSIIGQDATNALMFLIGFAAGGSGSNWEKIAGFE